MKRSKKPQRPRPARKSSARSRSGRVAGAPRAPTQSAELAPQASPNPPAAQPSDARVRARIRVYRQGLGDCILVRLPRKDGSEYTLMIDCGVAVAQPGAADKMNEVVEDIARETGGRIDVLAVTHEHWDHVSGFTQAKEAFGKLTIGEVWVAWTEDENDPLAQSLRKDHQNAMAVLGASAQAFAMAGQSERANALLNTLGLAGAAGNKTRVALEAAKAMGKAQKPRYWQPDATQQSPHQQSEPIALGDPDVTIYALGPPYDAKAIRKTLPSQSNPETYELKIDGGNAMSASVLKALRSSDPSPPFSANVTIPIDRARAMPFFQENYWGTTGATLDWRRIDADWLGGADELALAMQSATNNTSLVLAIELAGGDVLLFAGDAQVGNWESWQDRKWTVNGRAVTGPDLLKRTIFYKVGHHGSFNATLRQHGLELMTALTTAVIPVDQEVAKKMRWGAMPLTSLVDALDEQTKHRTLRTDMTPQPSEGVEIKDLYYEIAV